MSQKILQNIVLFSLLTKSIFLNCTRGNDQLCMECDYIIDKCVFCSQGYLIPSRNICSPVKSLVNHCIRYSDEKVCTLCNLGFYLDIESNSCVKYDNVRKY